MRVSIGMVAFQAAVTGLAFPEFSVVCMAAIGLCFVLYLVTAHHG